MTVRDEGDPHRSYSGASPAQVEDALRPLVQFRKRGIPLDEIASLVEERLLPHLMRYDRSTFQSMFNAVPEAGAALGAKIALEWNQGVTNWQVSPGGAVLEELCLEALVQLFGFAPGAGATFMYAGSYANEQGLYMALHRHAERSGFDFAKKGIAGFAEPERLAVVVSADTHFSLRHAVRTLGLGEACLVVAPLDEHRRTDPARLAALLRAAAGARDVFCIVGTAGSTSTGAVDAMDALADVVAEHGAWLHVDGAYGLAYKLVPERSAIFAGIDRADSVSWDPHKQFGVPIPSSVLFVRREADFARMAVFGTYFNRNDRDEPNPGLKSVPSTRPLSALPLVTSLLYQGLEGVVERLRAPLVAVETVAAYLNEQTDVELCHSPALGVACFRFIRDDMSPTELDDWNRSIFRATNQRGERTIAITELDGRPALRLVAVSPVVTGEALIETVEALRLVAARG